MKKSLLSALGLAVALAVSMPIIGASSADAAPLHARSITAIIIITTTTTIAITTTITITTQWWKEGLNIRLDQREGWLWILVKGGLLAGFCCAKRATRPVAKRESDATKPPRCRRRIF